MLQNTIAVAESIFTTKAGALAALQQTMFREGCESGALPLVNAGSIRTWLSKITHNPSGRHRRMRRYATAYYYKQLVIYNPLYLERTTVTDLLDTVLHELGHLFTYHFFHDHGHGASWQAVGAIVGYAEVGCTGIEKRRQYASYAAHGDIAKLETTTEAPISRIGPLNAINRSTVNSPVRRVWAICGQNPSLSRKEIIQICVNHGINRNTAQTQYSKWKSDRRLRDMFA